MSMSGQRPESPRPRTSVLASALLLAAGAAHAGLGDNFASVQAEAQRVSGTLHTTSMPSYDVHEIHAANGAVQRQYMNRAGEVFGVTWKSNGMADLKALLGSYYGEYRGAVAQRIDMHHSVMTTPRLVVQISGYMQTFIGRAYVPGQVPAGMALSEIH